MTELGDAVRELTEMRAVGEQMSGFDAAAWRTAVGDRAVRNVIIGVVLLDSAPNWEKFKARYERLTRLVPVLRERPLFGAMGFSSPRMAVDPDFDINLHLHRSRVPEGGSWNDVLEEARRMSLMDFDHDRPLWEAQLMEGLPGGRAALLFKLHHSIADGQATVMMGANLFELTPEGNPDEPEAPPAPSGEPVSVMAVSGANIKDNVERYISMAGSGARILGHLVKGTLRRPVETWADAFDMAASLGRFTAPHESELSPVLTERSTTYSFATFDLPFEEMRAAAKKRGFTVNDIFLASAATGMAKYHERHGRPTRRLRFNVPISLRNTSKDGSASNAVTIARFPLPVNGVDMQERLQSAHDQVKRWRDEPALYLANPVADVSWVVPVPVLASAMKTSDITASNVPGPPFPVYVAGSRVVGTWPLVATIGAAINLTLVTYDGTAFLGLSVDDAAVPDLDDLVADLRAGFEEVVDGYVGPSDPVAELNQKRDSHAHGVRKTGSGPADERVGGANVKKPTAKKATAKKASAAKKSTAKKATAAKKSTAKKATAAKKSASKQTAAAKVATSEGVQSAKTAADDLTTAATESARAAVDAVSDTLAEAGAVAESLLSQAVDATEQQEAPKPAPAAESATEKAATATQAASEAATAVKQSTTKKAAATKKSATKKASTARKTATQQVSAAKKATTKAATAAKKAATDSASTVKKTTSKKASAAKKTTTKKTAAKKSTSR